VLARGNSKSSGNKKAGLSGRRLDPYYIETSKVAEKLALFQAAASVCYL
jgi:hypothetical protein